MSANIDATGDRSLLASLAKRARPEPTQGGCARFSVQNELWHELAQGLGNSFDLFALWADTAQVHMAVLEPDTGDFAIASLDLSDGAYPSIGQYHAPAIRPERTIRDLLAINPVGLGDDRPWLDHGKWPLSHPLKELPDHACPHEPYAFLPAEGEGLHQVPVGPVHAGIIEPGHFRFTCSGETVVRLEARLGYAHKGIEKLLEGKLPAEAAKICARISGDSTVASSLAFARAVEAALETEAPSRAHWLRALMAEMERLANHFGDIGGICNDAAFALLHAHFGLLREDVLQAGQRCFGHRMMMDCVIPGGTATDLTPQGREILAHLLAGLRERLAPLIEVYDNTASLQDRTRNTGLLDAALARQFAAGGYVGRASARAFDTRKVLAYPPYDILSFASQVFDKGDVDARVWVRIHEAEQSMALIEQIVHELPDGPVRIDLPSGTGRTREGLAIVEGFRGDLLVWLRLDGEGRIERCHPRDPSIFQWPLLEAAIEGCIIADFPICNKSFNCSYSGHDL